MSDCKAETTISPTYVVLIVVFLTLALVGKLLTFLLPHTSSCNSTSSSSTDASQLMEKKLPGTLKKSKNNAIKVKNHENKFEEKEHKVTVVNVATQARKGRKANKTLDNLKSIRNPFLHAYKNEGKKKVESCEDDVSDFPFDNADTSSTMVDEVDPQSPTKKIVIQTILEDALKLDDVDTSSNMVDELDPQSPTEEIQITVLEEALPVDNANSNSIKVVHIDPESLTKKIQNHTTLEEVGDCKIAIEDHRKRNISGCSDLNESFSEFERKKVKKQACYWTEEASVCEDKSLHTEVIDQEVIKEPDSSKEVVEEPDSNPSLSGDGDESNNHSAEHDRLEMVLKNLGSSIASCSNSAHPSQTPAYQLPLLGNQKIFISGTYSNQIEKLVRDAYKTQIEIEEVKLAFRFPIAAFENILLADSPVVGLSNGHCRCVPCQDQTIGNSVCIHCVPNTLLGNFWRQYEMASCFGLEVNVFDPKNFQNSCRTEVAYAAYFVPYLSAVQLFQHSANSSPDAKNKAVDNYSHCPKLVFQYFEAARPHERMPFYDKIKELAKDGPSKNPHVYGDPSKLVTMRMHEIHPASWYCIAWYPIYIIPSAKFLGSFLSYHSLGFFIQRDAPESYSKTCGDTCIICPVIGLQCFNHQKEKWLELQVPDTIFSVRDNHRKTGGALKQRLHTLDVAAFTLSRAELHDEAKDPILNYHHDFEFFFSKRC